MHMIVFECIMHIIAFECSFAKEWNELQKNMTFSSGPLCQEIQRDRSDRYFYFVATRNRARSFDVKVRAGDSFNSFFSCPQSKGWDFRIIPAVIWEISSTKPMGKVVKGILLLYTNSPGWVIKMCLNSRVFTTALWLLWHSLWCQSPTPVLRSCLFKSCYVVSSAPEFYSKVQVDLQLQKPFK